MNIEARDKLIAAINSLGADVGPGLKQVARDLTGRDKPLKLNYEALELFDIRLSGKINSSSNLSEAKPYADVQIALDEALKAGVLITQDTTKERVRG